MRVRKLYNDGGEIASTILQQLGGANRLHAMTGAYNFVNLGNGLSFKIKNQRANYIKITLTSMDLYDVEVGRIRGNTYKVVAEGKGMYAEELKPFIEKSTGMYLTFGRGFAKGGMISVKSDDGEDLMYKIDTDEKYIEVDENTKKYLSDIALIMDRNFRKLKDTYIFWYDDLSDSDITELEEVFQTSLNKYANGGFTDNEDQKWRVRYSYKDGDEDDTTSVWVYGRNQNEAIENAKDEYWDIDEIISVTKMADGGMTDKGGMMADSMIYDVRELSDVKIDDNNRFQTKLDSNELILWAKDYSKKNNEKVEITNVKDAIEYIEKPTDVRVFDRYTNQGNAIYTNKKMPLFEVYIMPDKGILKGGYNPKKEDYNSWINEYMRYINYERDGMDEKQWHRYLYHFDKWKPTPSYKPLSDSLRSQKNEDFITLEEYNMAMMYLKHPHWYNYVKNNRGYFYIQEVTEDKILLAKKCIGDEEFQKVVEVGKDLYNKIEEKYPDTKRKLSKKTITPEIKILYLELEIGEYQYAEGGMTAQGGNVWDEDLNVYTLVSSKEYFGSDTASDKRRWFRRNGRGLSRDQAKRMAEGYIDRYGKDRVYIGNIRHYR